jgi:hypothetical protein
MVFPSRPASPAGPAELLLAADDVAMQGFSASIADGLPAIDMPHGAVQPCRQNERGTMYRLSKIFAVIGTCFLLGACAQLSRETAAAPADDESHCRSSGAPGTDAYAACLKNRDVAREQSQGRRDRTHRRVADDMLNSR